MRAHAYTRTRVARTVPGLRCRVDGAGVVGGRRDGCYTRTMGIHGSMYDSHWNRERKAFLAEHPLCAMHLALGRTVASAVVDHKIPHRGDVALFWDRDNWQALCKACHDRHKQSQDRTGAEPGCDVDGLPLDKGHHWG